MKGKLIWLDEKSYGTALNEYNVLIAKKESLQKKLNEIIGNDDTNILDLYPSIELNFFKLIESKYKKQNTLGLTGRKLCELIGINPNPIIDDEDMINKRILNLKKPAKKDFGFYTERQVENDRLEALNKMIESYKKLEPYVKVHPGNFVQGTSGALSYDTANCTLIPNYMWVKDLMR